MGAISPDMEKILLRLERVLVAVARRVVFGVLPDRWRQPVRNFLVFTYLSFRRVVAKLVRSPAYASRLMRLSWNRVMSHLQSEIYSISKSLAYCSYYRQSMHWRDFIKFSLHVKSMVSIFEALDDLSIYNPFYIYEPENSHLKIICSVGDLPGALHPGYISSESARCLLREGKIRGINFYYKDEWGLLPSPRMPLRADLTSLIPFFKGDLKQKIWGCPR